MRMLSVCVFVFALMVLTQAAGLPETWTGNNQTAKTNMVKRSSGCPGGWTPFNGRCFRYIPTSMSWATAERNCLSMGANLASVHNIGEYQEIQKLILTATRQYKQAWIGGTDAPGDNIWLWSDGSPFRYTNWCRGEPNNYCQQHCLVVNHGVYKCWDDIGCDLSRPFVCARKT